MKTIGLRGILMLIAFSAITAILIRWGGAWETAARVMIACLGGVLGVYGTVNVLKASFADPSQRCYVCGKEGARKCDYQMYNNQTCGRWCCHAHMHVAGKFDHCKDHQEGFVP